MEEVRALMRRQHGLVTLVQALTHGMTLRQIEYRVRSGAWRVVRPGVYAEAGTPWSFGQALLAVTLSIGGDAVISHRTAAVLWRMKGVTSDTIEVCTGLERRVALDGVVQHRSRLLFDDDLTRHKGVPVTSPARTIVDLSSVCTPRQLGVITDEALRHGLRLPALRRCVHRLPPGPGRRTRILQRLLADRIPGYDPGESDLETRVLRLLVSAGISPPRQQYRVRHREGSYRLDMAYPELLIAIELDGWYPHGTNRSVFDHDRSRANALVLGGWLVLRFTSQTSDEEILESVTAALALRSAA